MKTLILLTITTILFAQSTLVDGLERASAKHKREACLMAKQIARENYNVEDMNVGCNCERSDAREWMCFVRFKYIKEPQH